MINDTIHKGRMADHFWKSGLCTQCGVFATTHHDGVCACRTFTNGRCIVCDAAVNYFEDCPATQDPRVQPFVGPAPVAPIKEVRIHRPDSFFSVIVRWNSYRDASPADLAVESMGSGLGYYAFFITCDLCGWEFVDSHPGQPAWTPHTLTHHRMECGKSNG